MKPTGSLPTRIKKINMTGLALRESIQMPISAAARDPDRGTWPGPEQAQGFGNQGGPQYQRYENRGGC